MNRYRYVTNSRSLIRKRSINWLVSQGVIINFVKNVYWPRQEWVCGIVLYCGRVPAANAPGCTAA